MKNKAEKDFTKKIIAQYMNFVLENSRPPHSAYEFSKNQSFSEEDFYNHFGSFENLAQSIFLEFFKNTITLIHKNKDYQEFDAKEKLITFYFTLFEVLKGNRSYVMTALSEASEGNQLKKIKKEFKAYIQSLDIDVIDLNQKNLNDIQEKGIACFAWEQFIFILKFWLKDSSPAFEKTDLLIEKSLTASFDLINSTPLRSLIDLSKFLIKDRL